MAGIYQQDRDLDKLLDSFYAILDARPVAFIDTYLEYLNGREDANKLAAFYHRAGYELMARQKQDNNLAIKYLSYGIQVSPQNVTLLEDLAEVYQTIGQTANAATYAQQALQVNPNSSRARAILGGTGN